jgi:RHS repeat-associated protein
VNFDEYIYLHRTPIAKASGQDLYFIHADHLDTPRMMTNAGGTAVWNLEARPFGDSENVTGTATLNLRFPGQYYDDESGINYNYFRDYRSDLGRYLEADPIGLYGGLNLYAYVHNQPVTLFDPDGRLSRANCILAMQMIGGAVGAAGGYLAGTSIGSAVGGAVGAAVGGGAGTLALPGGLTIGGGVLGGAAGGAAGGAVGGALGGLGGGAAGGALGGMAGQALCPEDDECETLEETYERVLGERKKCYQECEDMYWGWQQTACKYACDAMHPLPTAH